MICRRRIDNVEYYDYTPTTIAYDRLLDAYAVARADIHATNGRYRIAVVIVILRNEMGGDLASLSVAISQGRVMLERRIGNYRRLPEHLLENIDHVFDLNGRRLR